jgi:large repetitive protein
VRATIYSWTFGDGGSATGPTPATHFYLLPGTYEVTLTVSNAFGSDPDTIPYSVP